MKYMILENLKQYAFLVNIRNNFIKMNMANNEQNHLAKYITEFKRKARPQASKLKRVKEEVLNSAKSKWCFKHLKVECFESLDNQNNQPVMINILH